MSRRVSRRDSLTGGTGDVNPQFLTATVTQTGTDTTTTQQVNVPIQRLPNTGRAQVLEILAVKFNWRTAVLVASSRIAVFVSTASFGTTSTNYGKPRVFSCFANDIDLVTSGATIQTFPKEDDLEDSAGHGFLVATDQIFIQCVSANTAATNIVDVKFYYRWKNVTLAEYIGIVQGQQ